MTFIFPFKGKIGGKEETIYAINNDNPEAGGSSVTTGEKCPNCGEGHIYRVYGEPKDYYEYDDGEEDIAVEVYDCKCPSCRNKFDLRIDMII